MRRCTRGTSGWRSCRADWPAFLVREGSETKEDSSTIAARPTPLAQEQVTERIFDGPKLWHIEIV